MGRSPNMRFCGLFTALHVMQTRYSDENSVRLSACLSVRPSHAWSLTKRKKICPDLYTIRKNIYPSFLRRRMVGGGATPSTWNFGSTDPHWSEIADFQPIIARSCSAVTPSEKSSIKAIIGSPLRAFQWVSCIVWHASVCQSVCLSAHKVIRNWHNLLERDHGKTSQRLDIWCWSSSSKAKTDISVQACVPVARCLWH